MSMVSTDSHRVACLNYLLIGFYVEKTNSIISIVGSNISITIRYDAPTLSQPGWNRNGGKGGIGRGNRNVK